MIIDRKIRVTITSGDYDESSTTATSSRYTSVCVISSGGNVTSTTTYDRYEVYELTPTRVPDDEIVCDKKTYHIWEPALLVIRYKEVIVRGFYRLICIRSPPQRCVIDPIS